MTHDWFSHLDEGHNSNEMMSTGCAAQLSSGTEKPLTAEQVKQLNCRPDDRIDKGFVANDSKPATFTNNGKDYLSRAPKTTANKNTAWWDASQLYGFDGNLAPARQARPEGPGEIVVVHRAR